MKRALITALVGLVLSGCVVAVEHRTTRYNPPPPPPPPPPATVTVEWHDARTVVLREYYDCDWDTVGAFEYYEDTCGIPEDDLFFLLHVSRVTNRNFHEVVFTYGTCNRGLWNVCLRYRMDPWGLYVDLPAGTVCPPSYSRAYGYYWRRDRAVVLTNYDCHALFWLRFSVNYYGWRPQECFTRWDGCVDTRVRYVTVVHKEYVTCAGRGGHTWNYGQMKKVNERPERDVVIVRKQREVVRDKCSNDVKLRDQRGEQCFRPPPRQEIDNNRKEHDRREQEEWKREHEERQKAPRHYGNDKDDDRKEDRKDDRKDDHRDDRKDDRKDDKRPPQPPPPPKKNPPAPPKKDEHKDDRKDDPKNDHRDDRKDDRKDDRDDRKDDRDDRRDDRRPPPPPPKHDDDKKDGIDKDDHKEPPPPPKKDAPPPPPKKDDGKKQPPPPPKKDAPPPPKKDGPPPPPKKENPPPPKKDDGKKDDGKKDDGPKDDGKKDDGKKDDGKKDDAPKDNGKKDNGGGKDNGKKNEPQEKNRRK